MRRARRRLSSNNPHVTPLNSDLLVSNDITKDMGALSYGYCLICGRKLKSEASKKKGRGRACEHKSSNQTSLFD